MQGIYDNFWITCMLFLKYGWWIDILLFIYFINELLDPDTGNCYSLLFKSCILVRCVLYIIDADHYCRSKYRNKSLWFIWIYIFYQSWSITNGRLSGLIITAVVLAIEAFGFYVYDYITFLVFTSILRLILMDPYYLY